MNISISIFRQGEIQGENGNQQSVKDGDYKKLDGKIIFLPQSWVMWCHSKCLVELRNLPNAAILNKNSLVHDRLGHIKK